MPTTELLERPIMFLDFDGTVTGRDAVDAILEAYADPRWLAVIGSRACLSEQMALVEASRAELDSLLDSIEVDEGFALLLDTCAAAHVPVHIVSDGFDYCIRRILSRQRLRLGPRLEGVRVFASRLEPKGRRWRTDFPHPRDLQAFGDDDAGSRRLPVHLRRRRPVRQVRGRGRRPRLR